MKISCNIIKDLLPLYIESLESEETRICIDEHLSECDACKKELEQMQRTDILVASTDIEPLKKIKRALQKKKAVAVAFSVILTLTFAFLCMSYLSTPRPLPYNEDMFSFTTTKDGIVSVTINQPASAWFLDRVESKELDGQIYYLSASTDYLSEWNQSSVRRNSFVLNGNNESIASVYYSPDDGTENILIFGQDVPEDGSSITLPRLVLIYYAFIAVLFAGLIGIAIAIKHKNKTVQRLLLKIGYLPCSYLIAHFLVKGLDSQTYALTHDLCAILIIAIPIYALCLLAERFFRKEPLPWDRL